MKCPKCKYEWVPKVEKPKSCPECKTRLGNGVARRLVSCGLLADLLVKEGIVRPEAIDDPEGYDNSRTIEAIIRVAEAITH